METAQTLRQTLLSIHRKSYPAYKSLTGSYSFPDYQLSIDHVQGDPFAAPSKLSVRISLSRAGFPEPFLDQPYKRIALQDYLIRRFGKAVHSFSFQAGGSGKSGLLSISRPGQEILERTACEITGAQIIVRFEAGFPANGRTINATELEKMLFQFLPKCVERSFFYKNLPAHEVSEVIQLSEDQDYIRKELPKRGLVAFVGDGAVLPRQSGASDLPMKDSIPFSAPESLAVTLSLPNHGPLRGLGIRKGVTLIAGGGYHGKSTLLKALERGVYNHIAGDGREYVITEKSALKLRAEDGRKVSNVDISLFINHLPGGRNTRSFSTMDASGSTSQAANIIEGIESGSRVFLIDEDTSATNFMIRDALMQQVIARDKEPITPFLERVRALYEEGGISTILVVGSCGSYFYTADTILQMDHYRPLDITGKVKQLLKEEEKPSLSAPGFHLPSSSRTLPFLKGNTANYQERIKIKTFGTDSISLGRETVDLRYLEQLVDPEQTAALAYMLRYAKAHLGSRSFTLSGLVAFLEQEMEKKGLSFLCGSSYVPSGLAMPRPQEIFACFNRY